MQPNILWYCTDQQRFDTIGALGNPYVITPTLDRLVETGTAFTHAYCQSPICTPSRSSFMTGMYPSRVHNCRNGNESFEHHPPLISKLIADQGYDCGMIGKFHLQSSGHRTEPRLDDGYRYWKFSHAPRDDWPPGEHDYADWVRAQGANLDELRDSPDRVPPELHQTKWASDRALEFLREPRQQPWFLTINVYDPHPPFIPPRAYFEKFDVNRMPGPHVRESDRARQERLSQVDFQQELSFPDEQTGRRIQAQYYAMINQIDDQLARIVDFLDASAQRENTVIVVTSDHGEALGDHGLVMKGCRFYEGLVRVPLIFNRPGRVAAGLQSNALVELLDMSATLLDFAGAAIPDDFQGRTLSGILSGQASPAEHREFVRCEYYDALDAAFCNGNGSYGTMYRDRCYKLVVYHDQGLGELYDLVRDPWEYENLWESGKHQHLKSVLLERSFNATMLASVDVGTRRIAPM